jgi:hypothetical protein
VVDGRPRSCVDQNGVPNTSPLFRARFPAHVAARGVAREGILPLRRRRTGGWRRPRVMAGSVRRITSRGVTHHVRHGGDWRANSADSDSEDRQVVPLLARSGPSYASGACRCVPVTSSAGGSAAPRWSFNAPYTLAIARTHTGVWRRTPSTRDNRSW